MTIDPRRHDTLEGGSLDALLEVRDPSGASTPPVFGVRVRRGRMTHALSAFVRALGTYVEEVANG
ncbi:hypothetical protein [Collinsella intestinalis]|uniref:hypothetical protein n=1 Tax=Collinsella intestinalis TaxID=147207 RepID=UPI00195A6FA7|nr:hypothetical protein [Collinsella intestinalis]